MKRRKKNILIMCAVTLWCSTALQASKKIELTDVTGGVFAAQYMNGIRPLEGTDQYVRISQDGKQIVKCSFKTGEQSDVLFDISQTAGEQIEGFDGYVMSPDGCRMLIQTKTEYIYRRSFKATYYIYTIASRKLERLSEGGPQQAPIWSPDGSQVAFVRENNIYLVRILPNKKESQVTKDGTPRQVINGIPDWVYEEEFCFNSAMTFNADGTMLCWIRFDESRVRTFSLGQYCGAQPSKEEYADYPGLYSYKYPKAGYDNSTVSVWSYDTESCQSFQLQVPLDADGYIPRIKPTGDANKIVVYTMNRHQDVLNLYAVNPRSAAARLLIRESVPKYVKEEAVENIYVGRETILLPSDRDGYMHLYVYNMDGRLLRKIGDGNYDVTDVYGIDEATGSVYFQAALLNAHDRQVMVGRRNGKIDRLTEQEGWNTAIFSGDFKYFVNTWSNYDTPFVFTIRDQKGKILSTPVDNAELKAKAVEYGFTHRETFSFVTSEGIRLDGWMVKPADFDPTRHYPVIMFQYSGPGSQEVKNSWNAGSMGQGGVFDHYLAQQGYIVVSVDGRGTGGRGAEFEKCTYMRLGEKESKDQVEAALYLGSLPFVDRERIGIWGWSFGGFNTLMSMSEGRGVFRAGVAVAPPTHWKFYDTIYTERYMHTPKENPEGYAINPIERASQLHGALLICHGMADDNVHPQNTVEYAEALVQADKDFREIYYANRNHGIHGGNTRNHLLRQIVHFFDKELKE